MCCEVVALFDYRVFVKQSRGLFLKPHCRLTPSSCRSSILIDSSSMSSGRLMDHRIGSPIFKQTGCKSVHNRGGDDPPSCKLRALHFPYGWDRLAHRGMMLRLRPRHTERRRLNSLGLPPGLSALSVSRSVVLLFAPNVTQRSAITPRFLG